MEEFSDQSDELNTQMEESNAQTKETLRQLEDQQRETKRRRKRKETEANTYQHRAQVSRYISSLLMWNMFLIESSVKHHAQSAREGTGRAQKQMMEEVSKVWGRYSRRVNRSGNSQLGSIMLAA